MVQYTGWLYEAGAKDDKGKEFDSSRNTGQPFQFTVGAGQVIKGWDQGVVGMKVGVQPPRSIVIPPELAYGDTPARVPSLRAPRWCSTSISSASSKTLRAADGIRRGGAGERRAAAG